MQTRLVCDIRCDELAIDLREIEISDNEEEEGTAHKDVVVVFFYLCGCGG